MRRFDAKKFGLFAGAILFIIMLIIPKPEGLSLPAWRVAAVTVLMAFWWITEALPLSVTALTPIVLFPTLKVMASGATTANYGNEVIYLFMGGFFLAVSMEKWNLHRRVALYTIRLVGTSPSKMILGFMAATAFLSMWISNTATAVMMVPIGIAVTSQVLGVSKSNITSDQNVLAMNFGKSLMLSIAYAASMGGVATIIGTPPNTIMVGMMEKMYGLEISFFQWMIYGVPLAALMLIVAWLLMTRLLFPTKDLKLMGGKEVIQSEIEKLGPISRQEWSIICVGLFVATCWILRGFVKIDALSMIRDSTIAIAGSLLLFIIPSNFQNNEPILDWKTAVKIPWDIILLFGGGLALASGFEKTGLAQWISSNLTSLDGVSMAVFVIIVVTLTLALTEVTSNTATATLLIPIMGSAAIAMGIHPYATVIAACLASSFAFMLPVATPPNAVVFGSGYLRIKDMAYAGFLLNIISIFVITFTVIYLVPKLWGIDLGTTPPEVLEMIKLDGASVAK